MISRPVSFEEKEVFDKIVSHPLQSFAWGEFRKKTGVAVERVGMFEGKNLMSAFQATFHPIPRTTYTAGYLPKGLMPDEQMLAAIRDVGKKHNALFVKLEPNVAAAVNNISAHDSVAKFLLAHDCVAGRPLFTKYTFILDLKPTEDELLANMRPKTRYNIGLAEKKGVTIVEDTTEAGMNEYLKLLAETTKRQKFYAHDEDYFHKMWEALSGSGMIHIFKAMYEGKALSVWITFVFNHKLYYPYGASSRENREVMASNLMMWEVIRFGKKEGCNSFDMWGSLGPNPNLKDPFYGFHRFKEGYGGTLTEYLGTFDYVLNPQYYKFFRLIEDWRWKFLKAKAKLGI